MMQLDNLSQTLQAIVERLDELKQSLETLAEQRPHKDWYTVAELAQVLGRAEYTVREWCRRRRINACKKQFPRGAYPEWLISHEELVRVRNEGLLPPPSA